VNGERAHRVAFLLVAILAATALGRPLLPVDETRYAGVAWEMMQRGDYLVPWQNGVPYSHKPPLLFWLMQAGWAAFGVNDIWPRAIPALFALASLWLTAGLARALWPQRPQVERLAPLILAGCGLWTYFVGAVMFDMMIAAFVLLGWLGLAIAWRGQPLRGFSLFALGLGGGLMSKGPVALLHLLPVALFASWWAQGQALRWRRWYAGVSLGVLGGAALVLAWAIPAGLAGGDEYRNAIFLGQTTGRITESFSHRRPFWHYLPLLPLILAPWTLWPRVWRASRRLAGSEPGVRFAALAALVPLLGFSLISGKQAQYLLPEFATFALLVARALDEPQTEHAAGRWPLALPAIALALAGVAVALGSERIAQAASADDHRLAVVSVGAFAIAAGAWLLWRPPADAAGQASRLACAVVASVAAAQFAAPALLRDAHDLRPVANRIRALQERGIPVAHQGKYHGQFHFPGRLTRPLEVLPEQALAGWLTANPHGRAVAYFRDGAYAGPGRVEYEQPYRGQRVAIVTGGSR